MAVKKIHEFDPCDRYFFDLDVCSVSKGYAQVDTSLDASYYGTWANPVTFKIVNYCEGDIYVTLCDTLAEFIAEIYAIKQWHISQGNKFGVDPGLNPERIKQWENIGLKELLH